MPGFLKRADTSTRILNNSTDILKCQVGSSVFFTAHIYIVYPNNCQPTILFPFLDFRPTHFRGGVNCEYPPTQEHPLRNIGWALQLVFVCLLQLYPKLLFNLQYTISSNLRCFLRKLLHG